MTINIDRECQTPAMEEMQILFTLDLAGNFKSLNRAGARMLGYAPEEICRMNLAQLVAPNYADYVREQIAHAVVGELGAVYEIEIYGKNGEAHPLEISMRSMVRNDCPFELEAIAFPRVNPWPTRARCLDEKFWIDAGLNSPRALILI